MTGTVVDDCLLVPGRLKVFEVGAQPFSKFPELALADFGTGPWLVADVGHSNASTAERQPSTCCKSVSRSASTVVAVRIASARKRRDRSKKPSISSRVGGSDNGRNMGRESA